jgi:purine-binding chemotaxis protein CheW
MSVREIRGWTRATPLPHAPDFVRGVINLRGTVLPVVDLSVRLGMAPVMGDARNVIIVVQMGAQTAGLLVDAVSDILNLPRTDLQPPPISPPTPHIAIFRHSPLSKAG